MHDAVGGLTGYQTTKEKAGIEAYQAMRSELLRKVLPAIELKLYPDTF
jgi:hypothetical protein